MPPNPRFWMPKRVLLARSAGALHAGREIARRFTPKSKGVLQGWYPGSKLEMDEGLRSRKMTKFGSVKHVYPAAVMKEMRAALTDRVASRLPQARILYRT